MESGEGRIGLPFIGLIGVLAVVLATGIYSYEIAAMLVPTPSGVSGLVPVAELYFLVILAGAILVLYEVRHSITTRVAAIRTNGLAPLSPGWIIPYALSVRKYRWYFAASALAYGLFYAVITSMIVYQPTVDFASTYGASVPSVVVTPVEAAPFFSPVITVYLVNHLGLLLVPLTVLLLITTSLLVGLNFAVAGFALDSRARGAGRGWVAGVGAIVGLFTGCPTCAGLFFANFLGGTGAVYFATVLGYYQPAFILMSVPVLLLAPYLTSRSLARVFRDGCVVLPKTT